MATRDRETGHERQGELIDEVLIIVAGHEDHLPRR